MVEKKGSKKTDKPEVRCAECDGMTDHYNVWLSPSNEERVVCWECQMRDEKNFFTKRDFSRRSRHGVIPR